MQGVRNLHAAFHGTAALNAHLHLWGFVDEAVFLTKAGGVGLVVQVRGVDVEGLDVRAREHAVDRWAAALRTLSEAFRVYQYQLKTPLPEIPTPRADHPVVDAALVRRADALRAKADTLFTFDLVYVVIYEGWTPRRDWRASLRRLAGRDGAADVLSATRHATRVDTELSRAVRHLRTTVDAMIVQLADTVTPRVMPQGEAFTFFRRLLNYTPGKAEAIPYRDDAPLDFTIGDSTVEGHRDHLRVDDHVVRVLTLKMPPAFTHAHLLADLATLPTAAIVCLEWQRISNAQMRRDLNRRRRHFFSAKTSLVNYVSPDTRPEEMLVDDSAAATVRELGTCLTAMEVEGAFFGQASLTIVLSDRDARRVEQAVAACLKLFGRHDATLHDERYNLLNAWLAVVPGNDAYNLRRQPMLQTHFADLSLLFSLHPGELTSPHFGGLALLQLETEHGALYGWNLHVHDVGHQVVLGATGSGKSFWVASVLLALQRYRPLTFLFDIGHSYRGLTERLDGRTLTLGLDGGACHINPFALPPTAAHRHFLAAFVRVLIEGDGQYHTTHADDREIDEAVDAVYAVDADQRRLFTVANLLPRHLSERLHRWVGTGSYAGLFDHADDTVTLATFQCIEFDGLDEHPQALEPLLFYVLHRINTVIHDPARAGQFTVFVLDEAWRFVRNATIRTYLVEALKTWRKHNAAVILATQSPEDVLQSDVLRTVIESCPTRVFLANPSFDREAYARLFGLNAEELSLLAGLIPRRQLLLKRPDVTRVLNLHVDPETAALITGAPASSTTSLFVD